MIKQNFFIGFLTGFSANIGGIFLYILLFSEMGIDKTLDDAIAQYREAAERWPESAMSLNALGYTLADRTDEYREAEKLIRDEVISIGSLNASLVHPREVFAPEAPPRCSGLPVQRDDLDLLRETLGGEFELRRHQKEMHVTPGGVEQKPVGWRGSKASEVPESDDEQTTD